MSDNLQSFRLQSFHDWYHYGIRLLSASGIADAKTDVWLLMEHATGITRSWYLLHGDEPMPADAAAEYSRLLTERGRRIPLLCTPATASHRLAAAAYAQSRMFGIPLW